MHRMEEFVGYHLDVEADFVMSVARRWRYVGLVLGTRFVIVTVKREYLIAVSLGVVQIAELDQSH